MIQVVTFDLDDTLWAVEPVVQQANQTLYRWLEDHAPAFTARFRLQDFNSLRQQVLSDHPEWAHSVTAIRLGVLRQGLADSGYRGKTLASLTEQAFDCFLKARNQVQFFQHSLAMIEQLHSQYRLGALSNGNADIDRVGLGDFFDFSFNADQVGTAKPHPLMFEQMLEHTGVQADQVIHVGDHPEHDILGAQRVGLHTLWVNLQHAPWPGGQRPSLEVNCLSEIAASITTFDAGRD